jgi:hypothetical protein
LFTLNTSDPIGDWKDVHMSSWPTDWSDPVRRFYMSRADRFGWPEATIEGVIANVEYIRALTESDRARAYFRADTDEGRLLYEVVHDGDEFVAIRQVEIHPDRSVHRYSWRHREDDAGFLAEKAIDPTDPFEPSDEAAFNAAWGRGSPSWA